MNGSLRHRPLPLRLFAGDRRGAAAVEFALIVPVMLLFYLGTAQVARIVSVDSKVQSIADTVGNLVTRLKTIDDTSMDNIFAISSAIMNPYALDDLAIVVTAVRIGADGMGTVHWSRTHNGTALAVGSAYPVPTELASYVDSYFVSSTATYHYKPTLTIVGTLGEQTFEHSNTFRPRKSAEITSQ